MTLTQLQIQDAGFNGPSIGSARAHWNAHFARAFDTLSDAEQLSWIKNGGVDPSEPLKSSGGGLVLPVPASGRWLYTSSPNGVTQTSGLSNGLLGLAPWVVPKSITIDRIGHYVAGSGGDAGGKIRLGIYADNGNGYPGALVLDAGQIDATAAAGSPQALTISLTLAAGLYWIGAAPQSFTSVMPGMAAQTGWTPPVLISISGASQPGTGTYVGYTMTGVTGALPDPFTSTVTPSATAIAKVSVRVA